MKNKTLLQLMLIFAKIGMILLILASVVLSTVLIISYFNPTLDIGFQMGLFKYVPATEISGEYRTAYASAALAVDSISVSYSGFKPEPKILFLLVLSILFTSAVILYILFQITKVLTSLKQDLIFIRKNALRLRRIALAMIAVWGISKLISMIFTLYFVGKLVLENYTFESYQWESNSLTPALVSGIVLWIIAEVFRYGTELKE
jgi:hypothetical protein